MKIFFIAWAFLLPICLKAQQYSFNAIPDSLIRNANAVKRYEEFVLEIKAPGIVLAIVLRTEDQHHDTRLHLRPYPLQQQIFLIGAEAGNAGGHDLVVRKTRFQ